MSEARSEHEFELDESGREVEVLDEWMAQTYDPSGRPLPKKEPRVVVRNRDDGRIRMSYRLPWGTIGSGDMGREAAERIAKLAGLVPPGGEEERGGRDA